LRTTGELVDPHTAVALHVASRHRPRAGTAMITLATAHPAKFGDAVAAATDVRPVLPPAYADLMDRPERCTTTPCDLTAIENCILESFGPA
jgi:threonine synthase